jgi:hypothetical protein
MFNLKTLDSMSFSKSVVFCLCLKKIIALACIRANHSTKIMALSCSFCSHGLEEVES